MAFVHKQERHIEVKLDTATANLCSVGPASYTPQTETILKKSHNKSG